MTGVRDSNPRQRSQNPLLNRRAHAPWRQVSGFLFFLSKNVAFPWGRRYNRGMHKKTVFWSIGLVFGIIMLGHFGMSSVPLWAGAIVFGISVALSVRYSREMFGVFLATIPIEIFPLVSFGGTDVRWYQLLGAALAGGVLFRWARKQEKLADFLKRLCLADGLVAVVLLGGVVSAGLYGGVAPRQTVILASFVFLYFLARFFLRTREDVLCFSPYFFGSFFVVALYGIVQNILFAAGIPSLEVMAGRPNATFTEADWFGFYAALGLVATAACLFFAVQSDAQEKRVRALRITSCALFFIAAVALIVSVARSAWLAAFAGLVLVKLGIFFRYGLRATWRWGVRVGALLGISLLFVFGTRISSFELGNRVQSVASGWQEITVACPGGMDAVVPMYIERAEDIRQNGCAMINLEEISAYQERGFVVEKVFRKDPNAEIRKRVWVTSLGEIAAHPVTGIGWGNIGSVLGSDERGATLSSSNIFLEVWLGSGAVGFLGWIVLLGYLFGKNMRDMAKLKVESQKSEKEARLYFAFSIGVLGALTVLVVFNMFNAAHFLAILWVLLAIAATGTSRHDKKEIAI